MGITGKGRCNLTNACAMDEFVAHTPGNGKFLYSAYGQFSNENLLDLLHQWGLETKVERGGRVFPQSDSAIEVRKLLYDRLCRAGVHIRLNEAATAVQRWGDTFAVRTQAGQYEATPALLRRAACPIPSRVLAATDTALLRPGPCRDGAQAVAHPLYDEGNVASCLVGLVAAQRRSLLVEAGEDARLAVRRNAFHSFRRIGADYPHAQRGGGAQEAMPISHAAAHQFKAGLV